MAARYHIRRETAWGDSYVWIIVDHEHRAQWRAREAGRAYRCDTRQTRRQWSDTRPMLGCGNELQMVRSSCGRKARPVAEDWTRRFDDTIETPDGRKIKTLDDARRYLITFAVPRQPDKKEMLTLALRTVLGAANGTDLMMHARIAVGRWVHRDAPPKAFDPDLKLPKFGRRKLKRDQ